MILLPLVSFKTKLSTKKEYDLSGWLGIKCLVNSWCPDWQRSIFDMHPPSQTPVAVLSWTGRIKGGDPVKRLGDSATITSVLGLGRSEVLRSLRHYLRAQSQEPHTIDRLEERGVERRFARRSFLKGRERAIDSQTNFGTVSEATSRKPLRDGVGRIWALPSALPST